MTGSGAYILGCAGPTLGADEIAFFKEARPWGFILFDRNIETLDQTRALTAALRETVGWDAPILIDQEGGRVQRLRPPLARHWNSPMDDIASAGDGADRALYLRMRLIADELTGLGIDVNCAPMADVARDTTHPFLWNRCYGTTPEIVAKNARAVATGLVAGGVLPVLKHIPGHGLGQVDSHLELPRVTEDPATLTAVDFAPFKALADLPLAMTAHLVYAAYDDQPATTSPRMIQLIRDEIGFDGVLMTDDISMEALDGSIADRCRASLTAGCDMILHCNGDLGEMQDIARVTGWLSPQATSRANRALALKTKPEPIDIPAMEDELDALLKGRVYAGNG